MSRIIVGMSGGVDSAVSAYLLKKEGWDVIGVTLRTWSQEDGKGSRCCEIDDARQAAWKIGIQYSVLNCVSEFQTRITKPFIEDYIQGITPNPCVLCNPYIKWDKMLYFANILKAEYIATGHYASIVKKENGRYTLQKAFHAAKDQTYMLYRLSQEQLARTIMPLGNLNKEEVRKIAETAGLPQALKTDSQEICFVTEGKYADYIKEHAASAIPGEGDFVDEEGCVIGKHKGIIHYTVGQRKGLGLALGYPAYVKAIHAEDNKIVVGRSGAVCSREVICRDLHFMSIPGMRNGEELTCTVKVRYHHEGQSARFIMLEDNKGKLIFDEHVRAASPGQSAVFYDADDCVIGGGIISEVIY